MSEKCNCQKECRTTFTNLQEKINSQKECENCKDIQIKKFKPLKEVINLSEINSDFKKCTCGKRPLDIVMSHILKIMIEEKIVDENASLRRNSPIPLLDFYYSNLNPQFIGKDTLILLHPDFTYKVAIRLLDEVSEVKGILKGNGSDVVGKLNKNSGIKNYELIGGCDIQSNIMRTLINEKIITNKKQSKNHIEVAQTTEEKLIKLHNYLENNNITKGTAVDGMCGLGVLGIYLLKYGFKKVIFNDIYNEAIKNLKDNLEINGIKENYEIYNEAFENLNIEKVDLRIIDAYPESDLEEIMKKAEKIADNIIII